MRKTLTVTINLFLLTIFITLFNCQKDNYNNIKNTEIQDIKDKFSLEEFNDTNLKNNLIIDWDHFNLKEHTDSTRNS